MKNSMRVEAGNYLPDTAKRNNEAKQYLIFKSGKQSYGIHTENVTGIEKMQEVVWMPDLPYYAKGNVNFSGLIVPVIDLNLRLGRAEREHTASTCIIVIAVGDSQLGFIVDSVKEIVDISDEQISPPPSLTTREGKHIVMGVSAIGKEIIILLNSRALFIEAGKQ